ncbi:hypothetical protein OAO42_01370 [Candidatus Izimaplasma bacterium]|nr:hypothetical protein [Candidatus Izimaplasma bacterium]
MSKLSTSFNKKKGQDKFLTYLIAGFAIIFVGIVATLIIVRLVDPPIVYNSFDHIDTYGEFTQMEENEYLVYWYGDSCSACIRIKEDVLNFAFDNNRGIKMYFAEVSDTDGNYLSIVDPDDLVAISGTPSLITVRNGVIVDIAKGSIEVVETLDAINNNTFNDLN